MSSNARENATERLLRASPSSKIRASRRWTTNTLSSARIEVLQQKNAQLSTTAADLGGRLAEATGDLQSALGRITQLQQQIDWFKRQLSWSMFCGGLVNIPRSKSST